LPGALYSLEHLSGPYILGLDVLVGAPIVWLHRANIRRLHFGTVCRLGGRAAPPARP
jgi:hypothetical protein